LDLGGICFKIAFFQFYVQKDVREPSSPAKNFLYTGFPTVLYGKVREEENYLLGLAL
jgi:hypothetical protein